MKSAITISLVPEAASGPFVFRTPLAESFATAATMGFDAVELFLPGPDFASPSSILHLATTHGLEIAAIGTGAGWLRHGWSLTDPSPETRAAARSFLTSMIHFAGELGAPAILGSMQGRSSSGESIHHLAEALHHCASTAAQHGTFFIYEPLNRYETNLCNRLSDGCRLLHDHQIPNVRLLADLFHMNIEETDLASAILEAGPAIGHVHYADSNRHAMGFGHTAPDRVIAALRQISYQGFLSAEILPLPDPHTAARQTLASILSLSIP